MYKIGDIVTVNDKMQCSYKYLISENFGSNFENKFEPYFSPNTMLKMGIFEGKYCNDCQDEYPRSWFREAKICNVPDPSINYFGVKSRQSLSVWREKGWLIGPDPRGWFQWYCRYYLGRRIREIDQIQIKRWRTFRRHEAQVRANCKPGDRQCRPRQRQALLQWAYDPLV